MSPRDPCLSWSKGVIHTGTWTVYCPHDLALIQLVNPERRHAWAEKTVNPLPPASTSGQNHRRRCLREPATTYWCREDQVHSSDVQWRLGNCSWWDNTEPVDWNWNHYQRSQCTHTKQWVKRYKRNDKRCSVRTTKWWPHNNIIRLW